MAEITFPTLKLSVPSGKTLTFAAGEPDGMSARMIRFLGAVLNIRPEEEPLPPDHADVLVISEGKRDLRHLPQWNVEWKFPGKAAFERAPRTRTILELADVCFTMKHTLWLCRRAVCFGVMAKVLQDENVFLCHGALLRLPGTCDGVILFGDCGVGKTSAADRFREQGGTPLADDKILLSLDENGELRAQGMPTWARWGYFADATQSVRVRDMLRLVRGHGDIIAVSDRTQWKLGMLRALMMHFRTPERYLPVELEREVSVHLLPVWERLCNQFTPMELQGDLKGELFQNLRSFLEAP